MRIRGKQVVSCFITTDQQPPSDAKDGCLK